MLKDVEMGNAVFCCVVKPVASAPCSKIHYVTHSYRQDHIKLLHTFSEQSARSCTSSTVQEQVTGHQ